MPCTHGHIHLEGHAKEAREKAKEVAREEAERINLNILNIPRVVLEKLLS